MLFKSRLSTLAAIALPLAITPLLAVGFRDGAVFAQSGGSGGSGSGGAGGTGGASGSTGTGGSTGAGSYTGTGSGAVSPGGVNSAPSAATPGIGPQSRSPAMPPSTVPQVDTGNPPVPSAGNAEPNSPIYRQDTPPGALTPQPNATNPAGTGADARAQPDAPPGGSGGSSAGRSGTAGTGDPLVPTDPAGNPAREGSGRATDSISEEPNRVTRGGASGKDLDECMKLWDAGTHMTKEQWKGTCERLGR